MGKKEQWKVIPGFEVYEISNMGNVRSKDKTITMKNRKCFRHGKILTPIDNGRGYMKVELKHNGKKRKAYVHRLVAEAFIENPNNKPFVNHIDNNPSNNFVDNLEWCTHQENVDWMNIQGRAKRTEQWLEHLHASQEKTYKGVVGTSILTGEKIYFTKLNDVRKFGFQPSCVCYCCKGMRGVTQHKGYRWTYEDSITTL